MKKFFLTLIVLALIITGAAGSHLFYLYQHREFGPSDFQHPLVLNQPSIIVPETALKQEACRLLNQKFVYLGRGTQMTAFESEDHQYVIKFFNPRNVIKKSWFNKATRLRRMSSLKWITNTYFRKNARLKKFFNRYQMAFQDLRDETGLIYVHLDSSTRLSKTLQLIDNEGKGHVVDLDICPFVLQKKVELVMSHLNQLMAAGESEKAKESIAQIYDLFLSRARKGYTDRLQTLHKNYGFAEGRAVQLDVGRIEKNEHVEAMPLQEMERILKNITPSLARPYPELAPVLKQRLEMSKDQSRTAL